MAIYSDVTKAGAPRTDHLVNFSTKQKAPFVVETAARLIQTLVNTQNPELETCLSYYNGVRDKRKFHAITSNYGIGNPNKLPFISLMQRHVKALMGMYMEMPFPATVVATDRYSIEQGREEMGREVITMLLQQVNQMAQSTWGNASPPPGAGQPPMPPGAAAAPGPASAPPQVDKSAMQDVKRKTETFTSQLERFSSVLLDSLIGRLQLKLKSSKLVESRAVSGCYYYRVWLEEANQLPRFEWIPENEMHHIRDKSLGSVRQHGQVVRYRKMLRTEVLTRWGHLMSKTEKYMVAGKSQADLGGLNWVPLRAGGEVGKPRGTDEAGNPSGFVEGNYLDSIAVRNTGLRGENVTNQLVDVYEVEFTSPSVMDEEDFDDDENGNTSDGTPWELKEMGSAMFLDKPGKPKTNRLRNHVYSCIRIGSCIYLQAGRYKYAQRPLHDQNQVYLTYNGEYGERSMILDTVDLQDKADLLNMHQDNLIALGGVKGIMLDINDIPVWFGKDMAKRIAKFRAYVKSGVTLVDRSQNGRRVSGTPDPSAFANSGNVDTGFDPQAIGAIREQLGYINEQAQQVSGVPRQVQGDIEERDGLGTTNQAIAGGLAVNRPLYSQVNASLQDAATDLINLTRITAEHNPAQIAALIGTAGAQVIATGAERFPLANLNVLVRDAMDEQKTLARLQNAGDQLVAAMAVDPKLLIDIASINNVAVLREMLVEGVEDQKQNKTAQLENENQQLQQQLKQAQGSVDQFQQQQLQLDAQKVQNDAQLGQGKLGIEQAALTEEQRSNLAEEKNNADRVQLEGKQLFFSRQSAEVADK